MWDDKSKTLKVNLLSSEISCEEETDECNGYYQKIGEDIFAKIAPKLTQKMLLKEHAPSHAQDGITSQQ